MEENFAIETGEQALGMELAFRGGDQLSKQTTLLIGLQSNQPSSETWRDGYTELAQPICQESESN